VKPTAVRAKTENSLPNSTLINISANINNNTSAAASVAASQNSSINSKPSLISSTPSKNHHQPSAAQILAQNNSNNNSIQSPSTILPTAPIAFSAVAKQNPGEEIDRVEKMVADDVSSTATFENGPISSVLSGQSSAPAPAPTLANNNNVTSVSSEFPACCLRQSPAEASFPCRSSITTSDNSA
jgi:hypothetical protein